MPDFQAARPEAPQRGRRGQRWQVGILIRQHGMDVLFKPAHQAVHQHLLLQRGRPTGAYPGRYGTGGAQEGCQTFTASPGIAACHNRSRLIALPTCPCSASGTAYPVC